MTGVAQGIKKQTVIVKQSALGSPGSTGGQVLRRTSSVFKADRDTFDNPEIVSHEQSTGVAYGAYKPTGTLAGVLSPATYKLPFAALCRANFAGGATIGTDSDVTAQATAPQFTSASTATYLTDGGKVGDVIQHTGYSGGNAVNNSKNFLITAITELTITGVYLDGSAVIADASGESVVFTVVGKKTKVPLTAHTNDYFSVEEWYSDISKSELFTDVKWSKCDVGLPATGNATVSFDALGLARTLGTSQVLTTPTAETTTPVLTAVNGAVYVNDALVGNCTGAKLTIDGTMTAGDMVLGSNYSNDISRGRVQVSGEFTGLFDSTTIQTLYDAETPVSLILVVQDSATASASFVTFTMGRIKITGDAPDDGEKQIVRTYPFTAEINSAGGAALAWDQTILTIQDSDA